MKKRLLALVLCCAVVIGLVPAMVTAAYTEGTRLIVTCNGESFDSVVLQQGESADLTAVYEDFMEEGDTLQWQMSQDGEWVNIPGETGEHLCVTSDMLNGQTGFRCTITGPEGNVTESNWVYVELAAEEEAQEPEEEPDEPDQEQSGTLFEDIQQDTAISLGDGEAADTTEEDENVSDEPENGENSENSEDTTVDEPEENDEPEDETYAPSHTDICTDNCLGTDFCDCGCHLYDRLMSCESLEEFCEVMDSAADGQFEFITDEQWRYLSDHAMELEAAEYPEPLEEDDNPEVESEIVYVTVNFTDVAPLGDPVVG